MKGLTKLLVGGAIIASTILPGQVNKQANTSNYNPTPVTQIANWKEGRLYWDMQVNQDQIQALSKSQQTSDYQINPFHQPNEIYGKETCHGEEVMII